MKTLKLSYSKLTDFLSCPKKFELKHLLGKEEEFKETIYTSFGSAIHSAIEDSLNKDYDFDAAFCIFKRELSKHIMGVEIKERQTIFLPTWENKGKIVLQYFFDEYFDELKDKVVETEHYFSYPIVIGDVEISFNGFVDLIYKIDDKIKLIDWKTGKKQSKKDNLQLRIYALILYKLYNYDISEIKYAFIKDETENVLEIDQKVIEETEKELLMIITNILETKEFKKCFSNNCRFCNMKKYCVEEE